MTLTTKQTIQIQSTESITGTLSTAADPLAVTKLYSFQDGTGAGKAQVHAYGELTLTGATQTLDMGTLANNFGPVVISNLKQAVIWATGGTGASNILVGGNAKPVPIATGTGAKVVVDPQGCWAWASPVGVAVVAGTSDKLDFALSAGTGPITVSYYLAGEGTQS